MTLIDFILDEAKGTRRVPQSSSIRRFDGGALPRSIVSGLGSRSCLREELDRLEAERVLFVVSPTLNATTSFVAEAVRTIGERRSFVFDKAEPNTPVRSVRDASDRLRPQGFDAVVSMGGGAAHDMAKALAVSLPSGRSIVDFVSRFEPPATFHAADVTVEPLPVITMPSTFSAADVVGGGAVTDTDSGRKLIFVHSKLTPAAVILDAEIAATTPAHILAASGMNAVHHCIEAYYSRGAQFITDTFALTALRRLLSALPAIVEREGSSTLGAVQEALEAASMSGLTYGNSWLGIGHSVCHSLGGRYGLSHGAANSVMVRHALRFNFEAANERLAEAARTIGVSASTETRRAAQDLVDRIDQLAERLHTPTTLRAIGLPEGQFEQIARDVMADPQTYWNPRQTSVEDVAEWLKSVW
jgi:alcohol dehydrogenase class IV